MWFVIDEHGWSMRADIVRLCRMRENPAISTIEIDQRCALRKHGYTAVAVMPAGFPS
jgi:hypothetical protein